jgi:transcriptional/translational regulatory protein YebC/TACO1
MVACKKDSDDPAPQNGVEGTWQLTALTFNPAFNGITDYVSALQATGNTCASQINFVFNNNGSITINSPNTCTDTKDLFMQSLGINSSTTWKVEGDKLVLTTGTDVTQINLSVNQSTMTLTDTGAIPPATTVYTVTFSFKRV